MKARLFLLLASIVTCPVRAATAGCPYLAARYRPPSGEISLQFLKIPQSRGQVSDLALRIRDERSGKDVGYYYFDEGSAPKISLISTTNVSVPGWRANPDGGIRPHGPATFIGMSSDGLIEQSPPSSRKTAPRFVIIPELGAVLKGSRISVRRYDAFTLVSCAARSR